MFLRDQASGVFVVDDTGFTTLIGPRGHVAERLAAYAAAGVTALKVTSVGGPPSG